MIVYVSFLEQRKEKREEEKWQFPFYVSGLMKMALKATEDIIKGRNYDDGH